MSIEGQSLDIFRLWLMGFFHSSAKNITIRGIGIQTMQQKCRSAKDEYKY